MNDYAITPDMKVSTRDYVRVSLVEDGALGASGRVRVLPADRCPHDGVPVCAVCLPQWTDYIFHFGRTGGGIALATEAGLDPDIAHRPEPILPGLFD